MILRNYSASNFLFRLSIIFFNLVWFDTKFLRYQFVLAPVNINMQFYNSEWHAIYCTLIKTLLHPFSIAKNIIDEKRMQRPATRCVKGLRGLQYPALLRELQLPSMQGHILRTALITAYKLFHGNLNLPPEGFFDAPAVNHLCGHQIKVRHPRF